MNHDRAILDRRRRRSGGLGRSRQPSAPVHASWTAKPLPGRRFPADRPRIRDSSSRRIFVSESGSGWHDRTRSFGKRCAPGCPVDKNLGDDRIKTAATTEVVVLTVLRQGRHLAQHRRHDRGAGGGGLGQGRRRAQHRHSRVGGGVVIPRRGDALQRAPKRPTRTTSRRLARAAIVLWRR